MEFLPGPIDGILLRPLRKFQDGRGWLCELFRDDEVVPALQPVMAYISETLPGVTRGPHEHVEQSDYFGFFGPGNFKVVAWDNRPHSPTYRHRWSEVVGEARPMMIIVPPGVVHAYTNVSPVPGLVFNGPNRLYKGEGRKQPVDEIRHEDDPETPFHVP